MRRPMSAIGTKRTCAGALHMSAFGGKADMTFCTANVCFLPKADIHKDCLARRVSGARSIYSAFRKPLDIFAI